MGVQQRLFRLILTLTVAYYVTHHYHYYQLPEREPRVISESAFTSYNIHDIDVSGSLAIRQHIAQGTLSHFFNAGESVSSSVNGSIYSPLKQFRNPCWMETLTESVSPLNNKYLHTHHRSFVVDPLSWLQGEYRKQVSRGVRTRMRCMPALIIGGVYKGGTTDLFTAVTSHPMVVPPVLKEPLWDLWGFGKMSPVGFEHYLGLYDVTAEKIRQRATATNDGVNGYVTLDSTSTLLQMYNHWVALPWNRHVTEPQISISDHLHLVNPRAKVMFMLREPASWLTSCYNFFCSYYNLTSPDDIHKGVAGDIEMYERCVTRGGSTRQCVYQNNIERCSVLNTVYYIYVREWLASFSAADMLIVKSEDYFKNRTDILSKFTRFMELQPFDDGTLLKISQGNVSNESRKRYKMLDKTIELVRQFMSSFNEKLTSLLHSYGMVWSNW